MMVLLTSSSLFDLKVMKYYKTRVIDNSKYFIESLKQFQFSEALFLISCIEVNQFWMITHYRVVCLSTLFFFGYSLTPALFLGPLSSDRHRITTTHCLASVSSARLLCRFYDRHLSLSKENIHSNCAFGSVVCTCQYQTSLLFRVFPRRRRSPLCDVFTLVGWRVVPLFFRNLVVGLWHSKKLSSQVAIWGVEVGCRYH